jgi:hypothetical protein
VRGSRGGEGETEGQTRETPCDMAKLRGRCDAWVEWRREVLKGRERVLHPGMLLRKSVAVVGTMNVSVKGTRDTVIK